MAGCDELTLFSHLITHPASLPAFCTNNDTNLSESCHSLCSHLRCPSVPWRDPSNPGSLARHKCLHFTAATWIFKFLLYLSLLVQANVLPFSTLLWHLSLGDFPFLSSLAQHSLASSLLYLLIQTFSVVTLHVPDILEEKDHLSLVLSCVWWWYIILSAWQGLESPRRQASGLVWEGLSRLS